jgi:hypothetical protein
VLVLLALRDARLGRYNTLWIGKSPINPTVQPQGGGVNSFGVVLWELFTKKKPYEGMNRSLFYERVVMGGERPLLKKKWPRHLSNLLQECWTPTIAHPPNFEQVIVAFNHVSVHNNKMLDHFTIHRRGPLWKDNYALIEWLGR